MVPARTLMRACVATTLLVVLAACGRHDAPRAPKALPAAYVAAEQAWRQQRVQELTRPDGWTALVGLHWLDPGSHYAGTARDNGIRLAVGPAQFGLFDVRGGHVRFVPNARAGIRVETDDVAIVDARDRAVLKRFRRDMDRRRNLARGAGHATVGHQRHALAAILQHAEHRG